MKSTGIVRKVDELGRIVLPKELRDVMGVHIKDPLEIFIDHTGSRIILKKYQGSSCIFCGYYGDDLVYFKNYLVCKDCVIGSTSLSASQSQGDCHIDSANEVATASSEKEASAKKEKRSAGNNSGALINRLYEVWLAHPNASQAKLAKKLGISQGYVSMLMKRMREAGLITEKPK